MVAVGRSLALVMVFASGCGQFTRGTIGPTATFDQRFGVEAGGELGTHAGALPVIAVPIGMRAHAAAFHDGSFELVFGVVLGFWAMPNFTRKPADGQRGWNGRLASVIGGAMTEGGGGMLRGGLTVMRSALRGGSTETDCSGSDKWAHCEITRTWHARGLELALGYVEEPASRWRITAAYAYEVVRVQETQRQ